MNKLMFSLTAATVGSLVLAGTATADFSGISWETVENSMAGQTTYRIYADVDAGDQLNAVYGDSVNTLSLGSGSGFYQNAFGGATVAGMNASFFPLAPSLEWDSFVTLGLVTNTGNQMLDIGIDFSAFEAGGNISTNNGSWFGTPDHAQVYEVGGRVLIGQFTVGDDDHVFGTINMQGKNADSSNWSVIGASFDTVPAPGALALLGLAGVAARRRRK
jgi:MYXO-CTERM domain-containing protein